MTMLIISTSLNPESNSRKMAQQAMKVAEANKQPCKLIDLRDVALPFCDGDSCYANPAVQELGNTIKNAKAILLAVPIYNYSTNAVAKNLVELTGRAWEGKVVGFLCAAGGKSSYMSVMSLANSLMLDFRCYIVPRFVYSDGSGFDSQGISSDEVRQRIEELVTASVKLSKALS